MNLLTRLGALLVTILTLVAPTQAQEDGEQSRFIQFVENQLSTPDRQIRLNGIRGTLSSNVRLQSITIADRDGVWLTISEPQLIWDRSALFSGRLQIERLTASRVDITRAPLPAPERPDMQARSFDVPQLPVAVRIGELLIDRVTMAEPVIGVAAVLSANGSLALEGGGVDAALSINRLDGPRGQFSLTSAYQPETSELMLDLTGAEPADGLLANMLDIPGRPAIAFTASGSGPIDTLSIDVGFDANGNPLVDGTINTVRQRGATQLTVDLNAELQSIVSARLGAFFAGRTRVFADARFADDGSMTLNSFEMETAQSVVNGTATADASGSLLEADLRVAVQGAAGAPVTLPFGEASSARSVLVETDYVHDRRQPILANITGTDLQVKDAVVSSLTVTLESVLRRAADTSQAVDFQLVGSADGIRLADPALTALVDNGLDLTARATWRENQPLQIGNADITAQGWRLEAGGQVEGTRFDGEISAFIDNLRPFEGLLGFTANGRGSFSLTGMVDVLTGAFDIEVDGASNLSAGRENAIYRLFEGQTDVSGSVVRNQDGTQINALSLGNRQLQVDADGMLAPDGSALKVALILNNIASLTNAGTGTLQLEGTVSGTGPSYDTELNARMPNGTLAGRDINGFTSDFSGAVGTVSMDGTLTLNGLVAARQLRGTSNIELGRDAQAITNIDLQYADADLRGELIRTGDSALVGTIDFQTPDLSTLANLAGQTASGAASGSLVLSPGTTGQQDMRIAMQVSDTRAEGFAALSANGNIEIADLFGAQQLTATLKAASVAIDGAIDAGALQATASGTPDQLSVNAALTDVLALGLTAFDIAPASIDANLIVSQRGQTVQLVQAQARNGQGLLARSSGTITLQAGTLDLQVEGAAPLALAQGALSGRGTQLNGDADFSLVIDGALSAPRTNGLVSVVGASFFDPLSNLQVNGVNALAGFEGDTVSIRRLTGLVGENGQFTGRGNIGLTGGLPANVDIDLVNVPYSDGQTFTTTINGSLQLIGPLATAPLLSGTIDLARTEIVVPEVLGAAVNLPQVNHVAPSAAARETLQRVENVTPSQSGASASSPLRLDLTINAPGQIYVRGRGLDAELGGRIRITGPLTNIAPIGRFDLRRGRLEFLSQRLDFDTGRIVLAGDLDPILNFVANTQAGDVTATVTVTGQPSDLSVIFSSAPALPQDEVIARIVFGRSVSELSPVQIIRLANAVSELSGQSTSLFGATRSLIGLDNLDVVDDGEGNAAVRAGAYINERVYLGVETGQETEATINLDLSESLTARGTVTDNGESQLGIFFERDY